MSKSKNTTSLILAGTALPISVVANTVLQRAGGNAVLAAEEFFKATLNNQQTRRAYSRIEGRFLAWCDQQGLELRMITPGDTGKNCCIES